MSAATIILLIVAVLAIAFAVLMYLKQERTSRLRARYGPEYERTVDRYGSQYRAESELTDRQKRVEKFHIRHLAPDEARRYAEDWRVEQARFVDSPRDAVAGADRLVVGVMKAMGYPMTEFEQQAEYISVDHPHVVNNYRVAHEIAGRDAAGRASTEDLRKAMVHYRALFEDLLDQRVNAFEEVKR
jgi:hypothetical protein